MIGLDSRGNFSPTLSTRLGSVGGFSADTRAEAQIADRPYFHDDVRLDEPRYFTFYHPAPPNAQMALGEKSERS
jgi:hypothetical protein